jgi:hypothetical protein
VEVINAFPDQLIQLEGRVTQTLAEATANLGHHTSSTVHADSATKAEVQAVQERLDAAQRDANQRFLDVDAHVGKFLQFMRADDASLEQRLKDALRQAAIPEDAEGRLQYLEEQAENFRRFKQNSPNMTFVGNRIDNVERTAQTALARADRAEADIMKLPFQAIREELTEYQESQAS